MADLTDVITYDGLAWVLLIQMLHIGNLTVTDTKAHFEHGILKLIIPKKSCS